SERALGRTQRPVGTAVYMAPEQAASQRLGPASDWYSMGVVLYEALTGVRPYAGSDLAVLLEKQQVRPQPPTALAPDLPRDLAKLCVDLLVPEPADRPCGPEILRRLSVHEDVLSARWTAASLLSARPPFLGRGVELARLADAFSRSRLGAVVARVVGAPGVGKTALCEAALRRAAEQEPQLLVLAGACSRYPDRPHAPLQEPIAKLAEALRERQVSLSASALRLLERAFPGVGIGLEAKHPGRTALAPEPLEQRWRTIAALAGILAELARARPIVIWLDDYQWADVDTQRFVSALVESEDAPRLLLLLSEEPEPGTLRAPSPRAHDTISLGNLSCPDAQGLIRELCERAQTDVVDRLWEEHRVPHSPLAMLERTRHALLYPDAGAAELGSLYAERVRQLSEPARRVLELVCAAFDPTPYAIFERAASLSAAEFTQHLSTLRVSGLVRSLSLHNEDALAPGHSLVAELVDLELTGPRRVLIHQRLASALVARDGVRAAGRLLRHQGESGDHARAAESAERAAELAHGCFAFQRAAELFTLRASLKPPASDEQGHRLLRRMAEALAHAGWSLSAAGVYRDAAAYASAADALHMKRRLLECLLRGGELEEGEQVLRELLTELGLSLTRAQWSVTWTRVGLRLFGLSFREQREETIPATELGKVDTLFACSAQLSRCDLPNGYALRSSAFTAAHALGEPKRVARALCVEAWNLVGARSRERARSRSMIEAARGLVERHDAPLLAGHLRLAQGMAALIGHQMRECSTLCRDAERVFRDSCSDVDWELGVAQAYQLLALSSMGHYRELAPRLALARREAEE
ncbi:MAG TPA: AAA family ATPase, partial [Polyangiales bacterium]|nr:AAA family ATPase [Polyangiales bacterium]